MMSDTTTEALEMHKELMLRYDLIGSMKCMDSLAAERDAWHAGWMEAEAKVSELEAERDALQRRLELYEGTQGDPVSASGLVEDLSSALEQYSIKCNALAEENAALKAELHEARMQSLVDFGKLQKTCEERDALKTEVERLREERNEFASHVVEFSELAASLIEEMSKKPNTTWGQVKAAIRALGDLGDRSAYQIKQKSRAALQENTDD